MRKVDVRITAKIIEVFFNQNRIASHPRLYGRKGQYDTIPEHMPAEHQAYLEWNGDRFRSWAKKVGSSTHRVVDSILTSRRVEQQAYRSCMGLLKLADKHSTETLEAACEKALTFTGSPSYKSVKNIVVAGLGKQQSAATLSQTTHNEHGITRGAGYYRR